MATSQGAAVIGRGAAIVGLLMTGSLVVNGQIATFSSRVDAVRLDVSVRRSTRPVTGLGVEDFVLRDEGRPQTIESASLESMPLSIVLVLDTSDSVAGPRLENLIAGVKAVLAGVKPSDRVALLTFSSRVTLRTDLTEDLAPIERALDDLRGSGGTSMRDAIFAGLKREAAPGSRAVALVFSDGVDNLSWLTVDQLLTAAKTADMVVYGVEVTETPDLVLRPNANHGSTLARVTATTGGRSWSTTDSTRVGPLLLEALTDMRSRYVLTYYPEQPVKKGWHELKVTLKNGRADILTRPGYFVP